MFQSRLRLNEKIGLGPADQSDDSGRQPVEISHIISAVRRQARPFIAFCLLGLALGIAYLLCATPLYTAKVSLIINNRQVRAVHDVSSLADSPILDSAEIESQLEVLRSEKLGQTVVKEMNLSEDSTFLGTRESWFGKGWNAILKMLGLLPPPPPASKENNELALASAALARLESDLTISRIGRTYVLEVAYSDPDRNRAAAIVNAYANAYMSDQLNSRVEATRYARSWLKQRTDELRELSVNADLEAQKFKADNNLLSAKGTLVSEQQFVEMTSQLVNEQVRTAQAEAQYKRLKRIIDNHETDAAVSESLSDPVINDLRTKYLDAAKHLGDFERRLDPRHSAVIAQKESMAEYGRLLFHELGRVAQSYRNEYEVAAARGKALAERLASQQRVAITANDAQTQLRQLEQKAESYKTLYQTYMQRYQEAAQQESFPIADSRIISLAKPPAAPSHPRKTIVFVVSLALGALAGIGFGAIREYLDRVFRTAQQVRAELGVDVLGVLPLIHSSSLPRSDTYSVAPIMHYSIDDRFSSFAETLRSAKIAADLALHDRPLKIIGFASLLPDEGKTTVAKNFASLLALQGAKTLLIDADARNLGLTRAIGCERRSPLLETSGALPPLSDLLKVEKDTGLQILPCFLSKDDPQTADGLSAETLRALMRSIDQTFDYVIVDLPPIGPVVHARSLASAIDAFIFVIAWGSTSRGAVRAALANEHSIRDKLLGVILNKVDMEKLALYENFDSDGYYHRLYEDRYNAPT